MSVCLDDYVFEVEKVGYKGDNLFGKVYDLLLDCVVIIDKVVDVL